MWLVQKNACEHAVGQRSYMCSLQCLETTSGLITDDLCLPSRHEIFRFDSRFFLNWDDRLPWHKEFFVVNFLCWDKPKLYYLRCILCETSVCGIFLHCYVHFIARFLFLFSFGTLPGCQYAMESAVLFYVTDYWNMFCHFPKPK